VADGGAGFAERFLGTASQFSLEAVRLWRTFRSPQINAGERIQRTGEPKNASQLGSECPHNKYSPIVFPLRQREERTNCRIFSAPEFLPPRTGRPDIRMSVSLTPFVPFPVLKQDTIVWAES
jgi:hypothetical protein